MFNFLVITERFLAEMWKHRKNDLFFFRNFPLVRRVYFIDYEKGCTRARRHAARGRRRGGSKREEGRKGENNSGERPPCLDLGDLSLHSSDSGPDSFEAPRTYSHRDARSWDVGPPTIWREIYHYICGRHVRVRSALRAEALIGASLRTDANRRVQLHRAVPYDNGALPMQLESLLFIARGSNIMAIYVAWARIAIYFPVFRWASKVVIYCS